jgi:hypothetical protein
MPFTYLDAWLPCRRKNQNNQNYEAGSAVFGGVEGPSLLPRRFGVGEALRRPHTPGNEITKTTKTVGMTSGDFGVKSTGYTGPPGERIIKHCVLDSAACVV